MNVQSDPLFTPFELGTLHLRNRFVMAPMTRCFSPEGVPGQNVADYYRRRAEAGVGLLVTEGVGIDHPAAVGAGSVQEKDVPVMYGDAALAGWRRVVDAVHSAGGLIFPQLWHMGAIRLEGTGPHPNAPSCRPSGVWGPSQTLHSILPGYLEKVVPLTRPMTDGEIADVIAGYSRSAANAKRVGFDGIAIHAAHGYLIDSFFWHVTNRRTDRYGGDMAARARFGADVVRAIRAEVGSLPILLRFSQWKLQDYAATLCATPTELEMLLGPLVDAGVDLFEASTRNFDEPAFEGSALSLAGWARKLTSKPSMCVGGIGLGKDLVSSFEGETSGVNNLEKVRAGLRREEFDLVAVGRALLVDPCFTQKIRHGEALKSFSMEAVGTLY